MNAMAAITQPDSFWWEARRICDANGDRDLESVQRTAHALRYQAYREAIQPLLNIKAEPYKYKIPKILRHVDGSVEHVYDWTDQEKAIFAQADELIAAEARRFGLSPLNCDE